jgi:hypothetical protein
LLYDKTNFREWAKQTAYDPFEQPSLPNALGKVKDERSVLDFARHHGPLGYASYKGEPPAANEDGNPELEVVWRYDLSKVGDPLEWVYAQARSVRLVLELLEAMTDGRDLRIETIFRKYCPYRLPHGALAPDEPLSSQRLCYQRVDPASQDFVGGTPPIAYLVTLPVARGDSVGDRLYVATSPIDLAVSVAADLVNENTSGVHHMLEWDPRTAKFVLAQGAASLIEGVWWHVASVAVAGDRQVKLCELCSAPFIVTDRRQRFCPAGYDYDPRTNRTRRGRSKCAALHQKRKERGLLSSGGAT